MNKLKYLATAIVFAVGLVALSSDASAQYGRGYRVYPGYRTTYSYSYGVPYSYSYGGYYGTYPSYSSYYAPGYYYSGTSLYVSPSYTTARVIVPPAYPVYRPVVPVAPGVRFRVGF